MERAVLNWADVGDLANIAQLTGLDAVKLIALLIKVTSNAVIRKKRCRNFARHLKDIGDLLETIKITELMEYSEIRNPLKRLEDALKESFALVRCCLKKRSILVLENRLNQAQAKIDECLKIIPLIILVDNQRRQPAKEYYGQLRVGSYIEIFGRSMSYEELYVFLDPYLSSSDDPDVHFRYIEAAAKTGRIEVVERVTRESNFYDADKTKNFLMEARLRDVRPLINVCERFGFVPDLIHYFYSNNMLQYIKYYIQKVNPINAPLVVGQLLDYACPEAFIEDLIMSVYFLLPVEPLVEECEKRNRLRLLTRVIERLVSEGSQDVHVHNALGKIIIDTNNNPENFLTTNPYYDSRVVGKYCEKRDPTLAVVAYRRG